MKKIKIIMIIGIVLLASGCFHKDTDGNKFKEEYEAYNGKQSDYGEYPEVNIDEDNIIKYSTLKEVNNIIKDKKSGVIYLGYPKCPWCRNAVPVLLDAADSTNLDNIYYVNMDGKRDIIKLDDNNNLVIEEKASDEYYELLDILKDILPDYELEDESGNIVNTGEKRIYVPLVIFVYEGNIVENHLDTVESQEDPYTKLTDDEYTSLYNIYLEGIHKVLGDTCDEECDDE